MKKAIYTLVLVASALACSTAFAAGKWAPLSSTTFYNANGSVTESAEKAAPAADDDGPLAFYKSGLSRQELRVAQKKAKELFYGEPTAEIPQEGLDQFQASVVQRLELQRLENDRFEECVNEAGSTESITRCSRAAVTGKFPHYSILRQKSDEPSSVVETMKAQVKSGLLKKNALINRQVTGVLNAKTVNEVYAQLANQTQTPSAEAQAMVVEEQIIYVR